MLYIRTDMNNMIGTGHVMRCLAIADAAGDIGEEAVFIVADGQAGSLLQSRHYRYIVLGTEWNHMDEELPELERVIGEYQVNKLLIDSYMVTERYLQRVSQLTYSVYIDDLDAFHYPVNTLICYANYADKFRYDQRYPHTRLLLGTQYVPLRREFGRCGPKKIRKKAASLLLISGGTDNYHIIRNLLNGIDCDAFERVEAICGRYSKDYEALAEQYASSDKIKLRRAVDNIKDYYDAADIVVSAAGITLYELCAAGVPVVSYTLADNQLDNARRFQEDGIIDYAGDVRCDDYVARVLFLLGELADDYEARTRKSRAMQELVDGRGALRILSQM